MGQRIDLVRYRLFTDGLLSLLLVESAAGSSESGRGAVRQESADRGLSSACGGGPKPVQTILDEAPESLRDLYGELYKSLTTSGDVEAEAKLHYVAFRRMVNVACVLLRPASHSLVVYLKVDPDTVVLEEGFTRSVRGKGHLGTGDLEVRIRCAADLEKAQPLLRHAYEAA
ncbi:DUF5655 domain-containing protein [Streptomyces silvisoli]|uniref:DUF5655 domain-containing protein n=1 Tax=Streptomyces silvisoli TaxID=3034235 RepID=A0ABT5ZQE5_9ACTN|nr:DUF5655 domain-containing protein [Streptomyces silvisoli]MDF3291876.1 DUF5655 domain-containing protein [Streptomyces silvisoli]